MNESKEIYNWGMTEEIDEIFKLKGKKQKLILEIQDLEWRLKEVKEKQQSATKHCILGIILTVLMIGICLLLGGKDLLLNQQPIQDNTLLFIKILTLFGIVIAIISILIYFCAMSNNNFWITIADFFKIEKLGMMSNSYKRQLKSINNRIVEIDKILNEKS